MSTWDCYQRWEGGLVVNPIPTILSRQQLCDVCMSHQELYTAGRLREAATGLDQSRPEQHCYRLPRQGRGWRGKEQTDWVDIHRNSYKVLLNKAMDHRNKHVFGFPILTHIRSWIGSHPRQQAASTLVGSQRRDHWKEKVPCRRSSPFQAMPVAVTVASQTPAGPASIWASPSVYSALEFTGRVKNKTVNGCCLSLEIYLLFDLVFVHVVSVYVWIYSTSLYVTCGIGWHH